MRSGGLQAVDAPAVIGQGDQRPLAGDMGEAAQVEAGEAHGTFADAEGGADGFFWAVKVGCRGALREQSGHWMAVLREHISGRNVC